MSGSDEDFESDGGASMPKRQKTTTWVTPAANPVVSKRWHVDCPPLPGWVTAVPPTGLFQYLAGECGDKGRMYLASFGFNAAFGFDSSSDKDIRAAAKAGGWCLCAVCPRAHIYAGIAARARARAHLPLILPPRRAAAAPHAPSAEVPFGGEARFE